MNQFKKLATVFFLILSTLVVNAQDTTKTQKDNRPVKDIFRNGLIFDQQTVRTALPGALEFVIQHRFGTTKNGIQDLWGIYSSSNVRLGLNYGITSFLTIGVGTTRYYKLQDLNWKVTLLRQTRSGSMPFSLSYYGNMVLDARTKDNFGPPETYKYIHRFSFFNQLILARKFNDYFSLLVAPSMSNFNAVNPIYSNANYNMSFGGRFKMSKKMDLIAGYDLPILTSNDATKFKPQSNMSFGLEIGSPTHTFQVFVTNSDYLVNQYGLAYNTNSFKNNGILVGLNITVRF
jgi:hypothetical protein